MMNRCLALACAAAIGATAYGQLINDDFTTDSSADYTVVDDGAPDSTITFAYDYGADGIPPAPNTGDGTTLGLRMTSNDTAPAEADHLTAFHNTEITGLINYTLFVDVYVAVGATSGTTEHTHVGVAGDGVDYNSIFTPINGTGHFLAFTGEGGSASDYRHFIPSVTAVPSGDDSYLNNLNTSNATGDTYQNLFPNPPYPFAGSPGNGWMTLRIDVVGGVGGTVTYSMTSSVTAETAIIQDTAEAVDGFVSLGHNDLFSSVASPFQGNFVIFDNLRVDVGANPNGACCLNDGNCLDNNLVDCVLAGGTFQGDGTNCAGVVCIPVNQACCLVDGTCVDTTEGDCLAQNGFPLGTGTDCIVNGGDCFDITPPNNNCDGAQTISVPSVTFSDTLSATNDVLPLPCGADTNTPAGGTVWYSVTGTGNTLIATTCLTAPLPGDADFDTQLFVFTGPCNSLVCVDGNDDGAACGGGRSLVSWSSAIGTEYLIAVTGFGNQIGIFDLSVSEDVIGACCFIDGSCTDGTSLDCLAAGGNFQGEFSECQFTSCPDLRPVNDNCADASIITAGSSDTVSNEFAQADDGTSGCAPSNSDLWWSFTPAQTGVYTIDTIGSAINDTVLDVFEGCGGARVFCDDDGAGVVFLSSMSIILQSGVDYRIRVAEFGAPSLPGNVTLNVSIATVNGACCAADDTCTVLDEATCTGGGGTYLGNFTNCGDSDLFLGNDGNTLVNLPFSFDYYGTAFNNITVSANGYLTFGNDGSDFSNEAIPDAGNPNNLIAPLWDDLDPGAAGAVRARAIESSRFIVEWDGVPQAGLANSFTFQAVLFSTGAIEFRYLTLDPAAIAVGGAFSVGIENSDASDSITVDATTLTDGTCIRFDPDGLGAYTQSACASSFEDISGIENPCTATCPCDFLNADGNVDVLDLLDFLDAWFSGSPVSDFNNDGSFTSDVLDLLDFLSCWFPASGGAPCP